MAASPTAKEKIQLTDRINRIQISPTAAVIAEADKLKARGVDVADFGPGEPDFPTPDNIKKAAIKAIDENKTKYTATAGIMPLREAVCAWHKRELGSAYEAKECVVNVGGKHSIFNLVSLLIQNGDEVIIPAPYWVSYPDIVKYAGGTPVFVQAKSEDGFAVKAAAIEELIWLFPGFCIFERYVLQFHRANSGARPREGIVESGILAAFLSLLGAQRKYHPTCAPNYAPIYGSMSIISCGHMPIQTPLKVASNLCFMDSIALCWIEDWWSITQSNLSRYPTEI